MGEQIKAWCVDRPSGTLVVIGTRADAEARASVMKAAGKEELMLSGPYDFTVPEARPCYKCALIGMALMLALLYFGIAAVGHFFGGR